MKRIVSLIIALMLIIGSIPALNVFAESTDFVFRTLNGYAQLEKYNGSASVVEIPSEYEGYPVTVIWGNAFSHNQTITEVTIPDTVTTIGVSAFEDCQNLSKVVFPEKLKEINTNAFYNCVSLLEANLPSKILKIEEKALGYYGDYKSGFDMLVQGFVINGYTNSVAETYADENGISFISVGTAPLYIYEVEKSYDPTLKRAKITKYTGKEAQVTIPEAIDGYTIFGIADEAFKGNSYIETVTIGKGISVILNQSFAECSNLETVNFMGAGVSLGRKAFYNCTKLANFNLEYSNMYFEVDEDAIKGTAYYNNNFKNDALYLGSTLFEVSKTVKSFTFDKYTEIIGCNAFKNCTELTSITIPESVRHIGISSFEGCTSLKNVEFEPNYHRDISLYAFLNCTALTSVTIPEYTNILYMGLGYNYENNVGYVPQKNFTIYAVKGSNAERYAEDNGLKFVEYNASTSHTHQYKTTTVKATTTKNGYTLKKCSLCDDSKKTTIYAAKTVKLTKAKYTYDGKAKKPGVTIKDSKGNKIASSNYTVKYASGRKNIGAYKVTVAFKGKYSGSKVLSFTINPDTTKLTKVSAGNKSVTVKWAKKTTQTTGYEIQYSTSAKFIAKDSMTATVGKNKTTSATIKKLKVKTKYFIRIRTYKTVSGKKYYSNWSASKNCTTK